MPTEVALEFMVRWCVTFNTPIRQWRLLVITRTDLLRQIVGKFWLAVGSKLLATFITLLWEVDWVEGS